MTSAAILNFFGSIGAVTRFAERAEQRIALETANTFNVFDWIRPNEVGLSLVLRELLDPRGSHGQGAAFLTRFLDMFEFEQRYIEAAGAANVLTEFRTYSLSNDRRIDLLIDFGRDVGGIAIENKPWAHEQPDQLDDYADHLRQHFGASRFGLVYLDGVGSSPQTLRKHAVMAETGQFKIINFVGSSELVGIRNEPRGKITPYPSLKDWLETCRSDCRAPKIQSFLADFAVWTQEMFGEQI